MKAELIQAGRMLVEGLAEREKRVQSLKRKILKLFKGEYTEDEAEAKAAGVLFEYLWDDVESMSLLVLAEALANARPAAYRVVYRGRNGSYVTGKRVYPTASLAQAALQRSSRGKRVEMVYPGLDE